MKILIVEDNPSDRELLKYLLEDKFQRDAKFREASNLRTAMGYLGRGDIDCVLLDLKLPDSVGKETFLKISKRFPTVPVIVMTHTKDRDLAIDLVRRGAADYILKDYTDEDAIFERILIAIEKHRYSVRTSAEDASSIHRVEEAKAALLAAQEEGGDVVAATEQTTAAVADLARKMFTEVQKLAQSDRGQQEELRLVSDVVHQIKTEFLEGTYEKPSLKARLESLEKRAQPVQKSDPGLVRLCGVVLLTLVLATLASLLTR